MKFKASTEDGSFFFSMSSDDFSWLKEDLKNSSLSERENLFSFAEWLFLGRSEALDAFVSTWPVRNGECPKGVPVFFMKNIVDGCMRFEAKCEIVGSFDSGWSCDLAGNENAAEVLELSCLVRVSALRQYVLAFFERESREEVEKIAIAEMAESILSETEVAKRDAKIVDKSNVCSSVWLEMLVHAGRKLVDEWLQWLKMRPEHSLCLYL